MRQILITGGAGFIGSSLARTLLEQGLRVDCVDNLITGRAEAIEPLKGSNRFRFYRADIARPEFLRTIAGTRYQEIYHLACPTGVPNIDILGEEMLQTCSTGTNNVLRLAYLCRAKVLLTSSCEVYGDPEVFPQGEDYCGHVDPIGPRSAYEEGKRFSEALVALYVRKYRVDARIVRIFNTFGEGMSQRDQRVIPQFVNKIRRGEKLTIYGDGSQRRTFLYIDDLLDGLQIAMERGAPGVVYNIGGEEELSISELCDLVKRLAAIDLKVEYRPHFTSDHLARRPDVSRIKKLGWEAKTGVAEGLLRMLFDGKIEFEQCRQPSLLSRSMA